MNLETIRMSSRGQIVIPHNVREEVHAEEGTIFAVVSSKDTIVLKKISTPSKKELIKELSLMAKEGKKRLSARGIQESDLQAK